MLLSHFHPANQVWPVQGHRSQVSWGLDLILAIIGQKAQYTLDRQPFMLTFTSNDVLE